MNIEIIRKEYSEKSTIGELFVDNIFLCYTLEDRVRRFKVPGDTAIPAGKYEIKITYSPKFKKQLPLLFNVPGFEGVRIHPGNTDKDTEGCILPGTKKGKDIIYNSRQAFNMLFDKMKNAEKIVLTITDTLGPYRFDF